MRALPPHRGSFPSATVATAANRVAAESYIASRINKARILPLFCKNGSSYAHSGALLRGLDFDFRTEQFEALAYREQTKAAPGRHTPDAGLAAPGNTLTC